MEMPKVTPATLRLFESLVALDDRLEPRTMFGQPAAFVRGNLCLGAFGGDVFLRLSPPDAAEAAALRGGRAFEPMPGRPMRSYRILPASVLREPDLARRWVGRSVAFTLSLPPKGTKPGRGGRRRLSPSGS